MKKKLLIFLLIIMMTISFVAIVFCFLNKKEEDSKNVKESNVHIETLDYNKLQEMENVDIILEENENEKNIFLVGNFSQNIINNENDALQEIKEVKDILGISNVEEEFEFNKENGIGEFKNYRMQQCYEGIPVDGMQLIISADKDNKVTSITGDYLKIEDFDSKPEIEKNELEETIKNNYGENAKIESNDLIIEEIEGKPVLIWRCFTSGELKGLDESTYCIHIDAKSKKIIEEECLINKAYNAVEANCSAMVDGEKVAFSASKDLNSGQYILYDIKRRIGIAENNAGYYVASIKNDDWENDVGIKAYTNLQKIWDFYYEILKFNLSADYPIECTINVDMNDAAAYDTGGKIFKRIFLEVGKGNDGKRRNGANGLDILAHEMTHAYTDLTFGAFKKKEINEGYADALGCVIENYCNGTVDDWRIGEDVVLRDDMGRDLKNPELLKQPSVVGGEYYNESKFADVHDNCTILGHTAYLMYERGFTLEEIAKIFAESCNILTKKADYKDVGRVLEEEAKRFTPDKVEILKSILQEQHIVSYFSASEFASLVNENITNRINENFESWKTDKIKRKNENAKNSTVEVGNYNLHYGKYTGTASKVIDYYVVSANIIITINEDQTYTYESTNQEVSTNHSGTWTIDGDKIVLEGDEVLKYWVLGNDYFIELQGSGFMFTYQKE